jgi:hypothetical protein
VETPRARTGRSQGYPLDRRVAWERPEAEHYDERP